MASALTLALCTQLKPARSHERRLRHEETGQLVDFFDPATLARQVIALCDDPAERARLGAQARAFAVENYDLETRCLPGQINWVYSI